MTKNATAAIAERTGAELSLRNIRLDEPRADEVLVRIEACGVCHTDLKFRSRMPLPALFGHEGTGVVVQAGKSVDAVGAGDRVILSYPWCGVCGPCDRGEPYRCENIQSLKFGGRRSDGTQPVLLDGTPITSAFFQQSSFATHAIAHVSTVVPVRSDLPPEMLAALPCGIQTGAGAILNTFEVAEGESLIVIGAGAVGLSAVLAGRLVGAAPLIAVDVRPSRLELALELGASGVVHADDPDIRERLHDLVPHGARYVLEASGTVPGLDTAIACAGQGGVVGFVSAPPPGELFPFTTRGLFLRVASLQAIVQGSSRPREFLPKLIGLQQEGRFAYEKLISTYQFSDINRAIADAGSGAAIKPVVMMPESS